MPRIRRPVTTRWTDVFIDADKDMDGRALTNLGDVDVGVNKVKTSEALLKGEVGTGNIAVRDLADTTYRHIRVDWLRGNGLAFTRTDGILQTMDADGAYGVFRARDNGVGLVEVARLTGAATAYLNLVGGRAMLDGVDLRKQMMIWGMIV